MKRNPSALSYLRTAAAWLGIALFALGLSLFAYTGTFSRFWADDYCYAGVAHMRGVVDGSIDWYQTSGNRFSAFLAVALSEPFGLWAIRLLPGLVLAGWSAAWVYFLTHLTRLIGWKIQTRWLVLLSLVLVYFNVLLAPDRLQTIYWRMGILHYTLPLVMLLWMLGWITSRLTQAPRSAADRMQAGLCALIAFFAAGFSETYAAVQMGLLGLLILAALIFIRQKQSQRALLLLVGPMVGGLAAMAVMLGSPSNEWRQAALPPPASLIDLMRYTLRYALDFTRDSLRGQPVPLMVLAVGAAAVTALSLPEEQAMLSLRAAITGFFSSLLAAFALILCDFAPSAYAGLQFPTGRALMPARFAFVTGVGSAAIFALLALRAVWNHRSDWPRWAATTAVVVVLGVSIYPLRMIDLNRRELAVYVLKAGRWDARDASIREQRAQGLKDIQVREVDVVSTLEDMGPDPSGWLNNCASYYYNVHSITAAR